VAQSAVPSTTAPSIAPPASVAPSPALTGWHLVALSDQAGIATVSDLGAAPNRILLAVGVAGPLGAARAWSSGDDGTTWNAEIVPADRRSPTRVVIWGERFLVGGAGEFNCPHPFGLQTWVRAVDDAAWTPAPADQIFCIGGSFDLAVQGDTAVMAGAGSGDVPFIWSSRDGLHWANRAETLIAGKVPEAVVAGGSGFAVFGLSASGPWEAVSPDGATWHSERLPGNASVSIVAAFLRDSQPAVITESGSSVSVIARDSGGTWQTQSANGLDAPLLARVVAVRGGLVALGGGPAGPRIWASADGTSWRAVELPSDVAPQTSLTAALVANDRAVLSGRATIGGKEVGAIWIGPASLLAP